MISVDTNILVRILTRDDELQCRKAMALFENNDIFINDTVILETEWVLRYAYDFSRTDINRALLHLCGLPQVRGCKNFCVNGICYSLGILSSN